MDEFKNDDSSKLEKLQERLYTPGETFDVRKRRILNREESNLNTDWGGEKGIDEELERDFSGKSKFNAFKVIFILAFVFFAVSVGYGLFVFSQGIQTVSGSDVDITIIGPVQIGGGEELSLDIIVQNNNQVGLEVVDLIIEYPSNTKNPDSIKDSLTRDRETLGNISPNSIVKKTKRSVLFGEEYENKEIEVRVEYRLADSTAVFEKKKIYNIVLQSSPIRIGVNNIKEISSSQDIKFDVEVNSNSNTRLENVLVTVDYPFGFTFLDSDLEPIDDGTWLIKSLDPNDTKTFEIKGRLEGQNNEERIFKFETGLADAINRSEMEVVFTSLLRSVTIKKSFFGLDIAFDGNTSDEIVKDLGQTISASVQYNNNLDDPIYNATIEVKISGSAVDEKKISSRTGLYRSIDDTIVWTPNTDDRFKEILPRKEGTVSFDFSSKSLFGVGNPEINFEATVKGRRVNENNVEEEIVSTVFKNIKFNSKVDTSAASFYGVGSIANSGPIPPKVDQKTTYTIQWDISNTSSDLSNARIIAVLPEYVDWAGVVSPSGEDFSYDSVSKSIVWEVGNVSAGSGYTLPKRTASFKVSLIPSTTQIGTYLPLIKNTVFKAQDTYTKSTISKNMVSPTTITDSVANGEVVE
ncbi:MAG: hypothetical protein ACI9GH_000385 [Candidatus Paceibacteria bacterium]|jgi:hypothetical protein